MCTCMQIYVYINICMQIQHTRMHANTIFDKIKRTPHPKPYLHLKKKLLNHLRNYYIRCVKLISLKCAEFSCAVRPKAVLYVKKQNKRFISHQYRNDRYKIRAFRLWIFATVIPGNCYYGKDKVKISNLPFCPMRCQRIPIQRVQYSQRAIHRPNLLNIVKTTKSGKNIRCLLLYLSIGVNLGNVVNENGWMQQFHEYPVRNTNNSSKEQKLSSATLYLTSV